VWIQHTQAKEQTQTDAGIGAEITKKRTYLPEEKNGENTFN
jgi:hypothetical protein